MDVELAHDAFAMSLHSAHAHAERAGDFLVAHPVSDVDENFALAIGQIRRAVDVAIAAHELVQRHARNIGAEVRFAVVDDVNGAGKFLRRRVFEDVAARAGLQELDNAPPPLVPPLPWELETVTC